MEISKHLVMTDYQIKFKKSFGRSYWRPISLLNTDIKLISKALATRLKYMLPDLILSNQTAFMKNRYISESGKLIYDVLETASIK